MQKRTSFPWHLWLFVALLATTTVLAFVVPPSQSATRTLSTPLHAATTTTTRGKHHLSNLITYSSCSTIVKSPAFVDRSIWSGREGDSTVVTTVLYVCFGLSCFVQALAPPLVPAPR